MSKLTPMPPHQDSTSMILVSLLLRICVLYYCVASLRCVLHLFFCVALLMRALTNLRVRPYYTNTKLNNMMAALRTQLFQPWVTMLLFFCSACCLGQPLRLFFLFRDNMFSHLNSASGCDNKMCRVTGEYHVVHNQLLTLYFTVVLMGT